MPMRIYPAVVFRERDHGGDSPYFALFPDLSGCFTAAGSLEALFERAVEAAGLFLEDYSRRDLPAATLIEEVNPASVASKKTLRKADLLGVWPVPVSVPGKAMKVNVTLDEGLLERIDQAASDFSGGRSGLLAQGARSLLRERAGSFRERIDDG